MLLMTGCTKKITESDISYAGPLLDNMLAGIKDMDYNVFAKDFDTKMAGAFTEDSFKTFADMLQTKIGDYQSRTFSAAQNTKSGDTAITVVVYKAKYSKETADVLMTVSYGQENGVMKIMGLYLNSPNLRK
jgi:hypothetical protein